MRSMDKCHGVRWKILSPHQSVINYIPYKWQQFPRIIVFLIKYCTESFPSEMV